MSERISFGGAPVVGFGATLEESETRFYGSFVIGSLTGFVGGGLLGNALLKGVGWPVVGTMIGSLGGMILGGNVGVRVFGVKK